MSDVFIPFNHQPFATTSHATTYTVLSGEYARVVVSYFQEAYVSAYSHASPSAPTVIAQPNKNQGHAEFWLKSGDVITMSSTNASGTDSGTAASFASTRSGNLDVLINGSTVLYFDTTSTLVYNNSTSAAYSVTHTGSTDKRLHIERYKELT